MAPGPLPAGAHPFSADINAFLTRQEATPGFHPTGLKREDYLRVIEGQVKAMRAYQNPEGRIIDPVEKVEKYYATPCYAHAVAVLAHSGHSKDAGLIESGMKALDAATADMASGKAPGGHGDFFTWPAMFAFELFQAHASAETARGLGAQAARGGPEETLPRASRQRQQLGSGQSRRRVPAPPSAASQPLITSRHRWPGKMKNFTELGMYDENGNPFPYDHFSRYFLAGMLELWIWRNPPTRPARTALARGLGLLVHAVAVWRNADRFPQQPPHLERGGTMRDLRTLCHGLRESGTTRGSRSLQARRPLVLAVGEGLDPARRLGIHRQEPLPDRGETRL